LALRVGRINDIRRFRIGQVHSTDGRCQLALDLHRSDHAPATGDVAEATGGLLLLARRALRVGWFACWLARAALVARLRAEAAIAGPWMIFLVPALFLQLL